MNELKVCRVCANLTYLSNTKNLFNESQRKLLQHIEELIGIQLKNTKYLPQYICTQCQAQAALAHKFRERCLRAQQHFDTTDYRNQTEGFNDENVQLEIEILSAPEEEEHEETTDEKEDDSDEEENRRDVLMPIQELPSNSEPKVAANQNHLNLSAKADDVDSVLVKPKKTLTKITKFICDQCGKHFKDSSNLKDHLIRHNDKQFQCDICPKKFFTEREKIIHIRFHTGELPIPCRYCEERFRTHSRRAEHERVHTNERPNECSLCRKSFATISYLKSHLLTHTGKTRFECTYCNVSFQSKPHLAQHNRTRRHQQKMAQHKLIDKEAND